MTIYKKMAFLLMSQVACSVYAVETKQVMLTVEEAQRIVEAWDRLEEQIMRGAREDTSGNPAAQPCCSDADLAIIRTCICAIKNQLCIVSQQVGNCLDTV